MQLSIIIPVYNEEQNIKPLYNSLEKVLKSAKLGYEIIFVDDGSTDNTLNVLKEIKRDKNLKVVHFRRNLGKALALSAGFKLAEGEVIITMDGDMQDDPEEIPNFIKKINEGYDLVVGWKFHRVDPFTKRIFSKFFNNLSRRISGLEIHDANCGFKAFKKNAVKNLKIYGELHRYIPLLLHWQGFSVSEIKVRHHPRLHGRSKYGIERLIRGFLDLITVKFLNTYKSKPFHLFGLLGILFFAFGILLGIRLAYLNWIRQEVIIRPLLFFTVLIILTGVQFISLGLLGEIIASKKNQLEDYEEVMEVL